MKRTPVLSFFPCLPCPPPGEQNRRQEQQQGILPVEHTQSRNEGQLEYPAWSVIRACEVHRKEQGEQQVRQGIFQARGRIVGKRLGYGQRENTEDGVQPASRHPEGEDSDSEEGHAQGDMNAQIIEVGEDRVEGRDQEHP